MQPLNLPSYPFRCREIKGRTEIFDEVRLRYVTLTPEEWVRQHFIMYLNKELGYPLSLMGVEKLIKVNRMSRRFDIAVFENSGKALILVECKAPDIVLSQEVMDQAGRYNISMNVPYLVITNGMKHFCFEIDHENNSWKILDRIPAFRKL